MLTGTLDEVVLGGALIGLAFAMLLILTGRVMSTSAMVGSLLGGREGLAAASIAFIAGLFISSFVFNALEFVSQPPVEVGLPLLVVGGLLVGLGVRMGNSSLLGSIGGLARLSGRAGAVILAIMAGAVISLALRQALGTGGVA